MGVTGDALCMTWRLSTIIVLVLLAFNFILQRSHHSLTLPKSQFKDSATVTQTPGMAQQQSKWSHQHNRFAYFPQWKRDQKCIAYRNNYGPKTLPCGTPDASLTSLLRQPHHNVLWNCVNMDNTEPQYPQSRAYREFPDCWPYQTHHLNQSARS